VVEEDDDEPVLREVTVIDSKAKIRAVAGKHLKYRLDATREMGGEPCFEVENQEEKENVCYADL